MTATVEAVRGQLSDLVGRAAAGPEFGEAVANAIRTVLQFDAWCLLGLNPGNGLRTFQFGHGGTGSEHTADMAANEAFQHDVNKYAELARAAVPAGCLSREHPGAATSPRFQEIMRPQGIHSELRLVLRDGGRVWGAMSLFRDDPHRPLGDDDVDVMVALADPLGRAVRRFPTRPFATTPEPLAPGVVLLGPDNRMVAVSDQAWAWLEDLVPGGRDETWLDDVTRVIYDAANVVRRRGGNGAGDGAGAAQSAVRTVSGRWLWVQGTALHDEPADVAVVLQPAATRQLIGTLAVIHGLTRREVEVVERVTAGLATKQIAHDLAISPFTVNDHLKAIYRKCSTAGREELLALIT
ncbi:MAG TPA: GAF domain-containing protein [Nocardioidaceae bacterium]|jgi:DNA-binding CsgD family transcriptional regulator